MTVQLRGHDLPSGPYADAVEPGPERPQGSSQATSGHWGLRRGLYRNMGKRALDVAFVVVTLPVTVPVILVMALLVALDGGKPFYAQLRVGQGGRVFRMWKLRSMVVDADERLETYLATDPDLRAEWDSHQKLRRDPRITVLGDLLRRSSLDELPQVLNVLKGEMSLVGPRPMMPSQRKIYPGKAYYRLRPGLTGLWQVSARNDSVFSFRAACDETYDRRLSVWLDLKLILFTVVVVLRGTGR